MSARTKLPHHGQILTTRAIIYDYLNDSSDLVDGGLLYCIANGPDDPEYQSVLYAACSKLWFLSKLVYRSKNGIAKLPIKIYQQKLFDCPLETVAEVADHLGHICIDKERAAYVYKCLQPIKQLLCNMIGCIVEQPFTSELVYAVDYVIRRNGNVDEPVFERYSDLFPRNYDDFHYSEDIAKDIERIEMFSI